MYGIADTVLAYSRRAILISSIEMADWGTSCGESEILWNLLLRHEMPEFRYLIFIVPAYAWRETQFVRKNEDNVLGFLHNSADL